MVPGLWRSRSPRAESDATPSARPAASPTPCPSACHRPAIGLPSARQTIGALNIYGATDGAFDAETQELALAFASYAAVAVANAGVYASTATLAGNLRRALQSRGVIDQAKGILMGRHRITADGAFDMLAAQSQATNRKLREIAADIVDEVQPRDAD